MDVFDAAYEQSPKAVVAWVQPDKADDWYVYRIFWTGVHSAVLFSGVGRLYDIVTMREFRSVPGIKQDALYRIEVYPQGFKNKYEALNSLTRINGGKVPEWNKALSQARAGSLIRCIDTGQVFRNQAACANYMKIQQGWLSRHINNKPGCNTIKGMRFERLSERPEGVEIIG